MIWMTWRQFRGQAIAAAAILLAIAVTLGITGAGLVSDFNGAGLNACHLSCGQDVTNFRNSLSGSIYMPLFYGGIVVMYLTPALIGLFWGAPLIARELETGTYRLAWNQSVTRGRWTLVKLGIGGLASVAVAGLLSLMITWWASPINTALTYDASGTQSKFGRIQPLMFAARGVAPLGYAAFAFTLGVTLGVLLRRTIPAMALTLALFVAAQLLMPALVRPHLLPAEQATAPYIPGRNGEMTITSGGQITVFVPATVPGAWVISNVTVDPAGKVFTGPATSACLGQSNNPCISWLASKHLRQLVRYQPASRFWPLQLIETAIYLVLAGGLALLCAWQVRRKRA